MKQCTKSVADVSKFTASQIHVFEESVFFAMTENVVQLKVLRATRSYLAPTVPKTYQCDPNRSNFTGPNVFNRFRGYIYAKGVVENDQNMITQ